MLVTHLKIYSFGQFNCFNFYEYDKDGSKYINVAVTRNRKTEKKKKNIEVKFVSVGLILDQEVQLPSRSLPGESAYGIVILMIIYICMYIHTSIKLL